MLPAEWSISTLRFTATPISRTGWDGPYTEGHGRCDSMQLLDLIESMTPASGAEAERPIPQDGAAPGVAVIEAVTRYRNRLILAYAKTQTGFHVTDSPTVRSRCRPRLRRRGT